MTMQAETADRCDEVIKALASPVRRQILAWMKHPAQNFPGQDHPYEFGVCAGRIDARLPLSQSTVSAHLATLQQAGLITARKIGQWVFYKRDEQAIAAFVEQLEQSL